MCVRARAHLNRKIKCEYSARHSMLFYIKLNSISRRQGSLVRTHAHTYTAPACACLYVCMFVMEYFTLFYSIEQININNN